MQVPPELPRPAAEPGPEDTRQPGGAARPPQEQAGDQHDDRPAGRKLDQVRAAIAGQEFAVQAENDPHDAVILVDHLEHLKRVGPHIDPDLLSAPADDHARR